MRIDAENPEIFTKDSACEALAAIYPELRRIARRLLSRERVNHTLQPTALAHEAVCQLLRKEAEGLDPQTLLIYGIRQMKTILIDSGRRHQTRMRSQAKLNAHWHWHSFPSDQLFHLHHCLDRLHLLDPRAAQLFDLTFYGGLSVAQAAAFLAISERTAHNDLTFVRSWLASNW